MARNMKVLRNGAVLLGVGALLAAAATPGAVAQSSSEPASAAITRALLTVADGANKEIERQILVTQIQTDGQGPLSFKVPVVEGAAPKNMDGFGGPTVENGQAVYNIDANGPETFRTQQDGAPVKVPVKLTVKAKLNGKPIEPTELKNVTGEVELAYTAENLTNTPVTLKYENGNGDIVEEPTDIKTGMGGTFEMTFPPSWANFQSEDVEVISGDGAGSTLVSGGFTLMEPFGEPTGTITLKAQVTNGSLPPATLQFLVLEPKDNPTARALSEQLQGGATSGQDIFAGGKTLDSGADQLIEGLTTAVDGATQIADGVEFTLLDGVNRLWESFSEGAKDKAANADSQLVETVRGEQAYQDLLGGFDTINSDQGLFKAQEIIRKVIDNLGAPFDPTKVEQTNANGVPVGGFYSGAQTANSMISTLLFGGKGLTAGNPQLGITNPNCNVNDPTNLSNPCGVVQLLDLASAALKAESNPIFKQVDIARNQLLPPGKVWPSGCQGGPPGDKGAFPDAYGCNYSPLGAAAAIKGGETSVATLLAALGLSLGKGPLTSTSTGSQGDNPTKQLDPTFDLYPPSLKFGVCPGPKYPDEDQVAAHCSATQVLSFVAGAISGTTVNFTQTTSKIVPATFTSEWYDPTYGAVAPGCVVVPNSYPPKTIPPAPNTDTQVVPYGLSCAVRTLQSSLNNILLPTIAVGVQDQTVESLGDGVYSPDCNPDATPTLTCGISAIRAGIIDPLQPGTRQLADGLPAALDGVKTVKTDGAGALMEKGNAAAEDYGRKVALYNAMNNPDLVSKYIPGGAPTGQDITYNGVYKYELAGVGPQGANTGTNLALGALGLLAAIGAGAFAASRSRG